MSAKPFKMLVSKMATFPSVSAAPSEFPMAEMASSTPFVGVFWRGCYIFWK